MEPDPSFGHTWVNRFPWDSVPPFGPWKSLSANPSESLQESLATRFPHLHKRPRAGTCVHYENFSSTQNILLGPNFIFGPPTWEYARSSFPVFILSVSSETLLIPLGSLIMVAAKPSYHQNTFQRVHRQTCLKTCEGRWVSPTTRQASWVIRT